MPSHYYERRNTSNKTRTVHRKSARAKTKDIFIKKLRCASRVKNSEIAFHDLHDHHDRAHAMNGSDVPTGCPPIADAHRQRAGQRVGIEQ
jgi:hypothetical protein